MNKKAIIYCRVSTNRQAKDELPVDSQLDSCRAKAESLGVEVEKVFLDEGFTASNDRRPAFQDAIVYCEVFEPEYFITWSSSRFARNKRDASYYKDRLDTCGTRIVYVSMDIDISTTPGWMIDGFMELADEYYSRQTSDDTKRSMMRNARSGFWNGGIPPYGFKPVESPINPKRKSLIPVDSEAEIANMIFNLKADRGMGALSIMKQLNEQSILNRGKLWRLSTLRELLKNKALIGKTVFGKTSRGKKRKVNPEEQWIIVDSHSPVISEKLFYKVQDMLKNENPVYTRENTVHLLVGMIHCTECNSRMHIESASGRSKKYYYYYCRAAKLEKVHKYTRYRADIIDEALINAVNTLLFNTDVLSEISGELKSVKNHWDKEVLSKSQVLQREIADLEKKNKNLLDVIQDLGVNALNISDITARVQGNTELINIQKIKMRELQREDIDSINLNIDVTVLRDLLKQILSNREDLENLRHFLQSFIKKVEINKKKILINYEPHHLFSDAVRNPCGWLPGTSVVGTKRIVVELPDMKARRKRA